jgi:hypothetical protein
MTSAKNQKTSSAASATTGAGSASAQAGPHARPWNPADFADAGRQAWDYWVDAGQRAVLFLDALRQRGNGYLEQQQRTAPHVLKFQGELVMDGRQLARPVNYGLVRILPEGGGPVDPRKRPFVVIDPRAGHGPGIGGFKADSEIGVALKAGHPCYFIGFLPVPVDGQTIEDVLHAFAAFLERVIALHPESDGRPAVVGNCQAGWATMMVAAMRPELFGPIIAAGSPLSYWAGAPGQNPMRYTGGLLGGSWATALAGDLGNGKFDGAWLVVNFESLNPANTLWSKSHNLYARVDSEVPRYLDFERWWGGHVLLNAQEMQFIVDELFVGNKLATGGILLANGVRLDLRDIRSPIIVFCSKGDNITPPPQALGWITDLYDSVDDIRAHGQTIVYAVHESIGHLGIFVSGSVAKKEHEEFASNIDLIDVLPPGLYEAVITPKQADMIGSDLVAGDFLVRLEPRSLDDVRAIVGGSAEEERCFAAVARVSQINHGLYRSLLQPWFRVWTTEAAADWMRRAHPLRLQYELFADTNPFMRGIAGLAEHVRAERRLVSAENPFWEAQERASTEIEKLLDSYRDARDRLGEQLFEAVYGSPQVQALVGLKGDDGPVRQKPGEDADHRRFVAHRIEELKGAIALGGVREAVIRAILYIRMAEGAADERSFNVLRRLRAEHGGNLPLGTFKEILRAQYFMVLLEEDRAIAAIPTMLASDPGGAAQALDWMKRMFAATGLATEAARARAAEIEKLFTAAAPGPRKLSA